MRTPIAERADVIDAIADGLEARLEDLTTLGIVEVGVPVPVSAMTQQMTIDCSGPWRKRPGTSPSSRSGRAPTAVSPASREPNGVVAVIIPWNGPIGTIASSVIPALAAGNLVVLRPPPEAPLSPSVFADVIGDPCCSGTDSRGGQRPGGRPGRYPRPWSPTPTSTTSPSLAAPPPAGAS